MSLSPTLYFPSIHQIWGSRRPPSKLQPNGWRSTKLLHLETRWLVVRKSYSFRQSPRWVNADRTQYVWCAIVERNDHHCGDDLTVIVFIKINCCCVTGRLAIVASAKQQLWQVFWLKIQFLYFTRQLLLLRSRKWITMAPTVSSYEHSLTRNTLYHTKRLMLLSTISYGQSGLNVIIFKAANAIA